MIDIPELFPELPAHDSHVNEREVREQLPPAALTIVPPDAERTWRINFSVGSDAEAWAYNSAMRKVVKQAKFTPYEITGQDNEPNHKAGFHSWEINPGLTPSGRSRRSTADGAIVTSADQLEVLLPKIHSEAQEYFLVARK